MTDINRTLVVTQVRHRLESQSDNLRAQKSAKPIKGQQHPQTGWRTDMAAKQMKLTECDKRATLDEIEKTIKGRN